MTLNAKHRSLKAADSIRRQLEEIFKRQKHKIINIENSATEYCENIEKCILEGYFTQVAHLQKSGHYLTLRDNQVVLIHPSTVLGYKPEWVLYNEYVLTKKNYIRTVMEVKPEWFFEISKDYFNIDEMIEGEAKRSLVRVRKDMEDKKKVTLKSKTPIGPLSIIYKCSRYSPGRLNYQWH